MVFANNSFETNVDSILFFDNLNSIYNKSDNGFYLDAKILYIYWRTNTLSGNGAVIVNKYLNLFLKL